MLLPGSPLAVVASPVRPSENAVAFLQIILVLALVRPSVAPPEDPAAVHSVSPPLALEHPATVPPIVAVTMQVILEKVTLVA
eukprot:CAMPEP_0170445310 /NCGR_PEP_ID=MMETSP0117_2-20130122/48994_1 /TAXON_ID=400756 /ORGANISM="Durinskia baltica, Strain CSIRO CS-38" /LENGTH=81 /DNA_ID=CAMNT_0010706179 /DNA_START=158 /DNA_END=403 /DNA_ORIENTATION=-